MLGFSKEAWESTGGNLVEYSQIKVTIHCQRRWQYYIFKLAVPQFFCTLFSFSSLLYPINHDTSTTSIAGHPMDFDSLVERNSVAATILLASFALLYVVADSLPKTTYQTTMDKYILVNLFIQFCVAFVSWVTSGAFFGLSEIQARTTNLVALLGLAGFQLSTTLWLLGRPMLRAFRRNRTERPDTLVDGGGPSARFFPFVTFVNVFPPWKAGSPNPVKLEERAYPASGRGAGTLGTLSEQIAIGTEWDATAAEGHLEKTSATRPPVQQTAAV